MGLVLVYNPTMSPTLQSLTRIENRDIKNLRPKSQLRQIVGPSYRTWEVIRTMPLDGK
jgi:hypothetical protein